MKRSPPRVDRVVRSVFCKLAMGGPCVELNEVLGHPEIIGMHIGRGVFGAESVDAKRTFSQLERNLGLNKTHWFHSRKALLYAFFVPGSNFFRTGFPGGMAWKSNPF